LKLIPYEDKKILDLYDAARVRAYKSKVTNANLTEFSQKIEHDGVWCAVYDAQYIEYFNHSELERIITIDQIPNEDFFN
jgi:hypothetical protein